MPQRKPKKHSAGGLIAKIRKPMAPPSRTIEDPTKYKRERELEKLRRDDKSGNSGCQRPCEDKFESESSAPASSARTTR
jgi:hypothetical protein